MTTPPDVSLDFGPAVSTMTGMLVDMLPYALGIVALSIGVTWAIKKFRGIAK